VKRISDERVRVTGEEERLSGELRRIACGADTIDAEERCLAVYDELAVPVTQRDEMDAIAHELRSSARAGR
jgi:hypothetical protein